MMAGKRKADATGSPWWIKLEPLPGDVPAEIRVRRLLKIALRSLDLKCEAIRDKPPEGSDHADR